MLQKLLRSTSLRTLVLVYVLIAASFVFFVQASPASAQEQRTNLVVGLQLDMPNLDFFDVATNTIWKGYQLQFNWEPLFTFDPDYAVYADLANSSMGGANCPAGQVGQPGYCVDASGLNVTVYLRHGVTFTDGQPFTADDVVFTYQTLGWSTYANGISKGIWWPTPSYPLWNSTSNSLGATCTAPGGMPYACKSHVGVVKIDQYTVKFSFVPHALPGGQTGGYALWMYDTLDMPIIPAHIWMTHLVPTGQVNYSNSANPCPGSGCVSDTFDRGIDTSYGASMAQVGATVGTGPFMLTSWTKNSGSTLKVYPNYWGKSVYHNWKGTNYYFSPQYLTEMDFVVYGSLDVVSLALQRGEIDTMLWTLQSGFLNQIKSNPAITAYQSLDSGFFYFSFNLLKSPWNQLILRQAISMAIDKDYIVNTLLGGFGTKGTVPISALNFNYVNTSVSPPDFNIAAGRALLLAHGYTIDPATGFFNDPSGNPIKGTILVPPKDYDPVRADAGIMISNNLKAMGQDIDAAPTSFNTIVAKFLVAPITYDMYVLGWSLGPFPEAYICTFFCSDQMTSINPSGSNSAQYSNPVVDQKINQALYTIDTTARQKLIKDVEGIVTDALAWNVLYYRKNLGAYRNDVFAGWVNFPPISSSSFGVFNFYTLVNLHPVGATITPGSSGVLSVTSSMPDQVYYRENVPINVFVSQSGAPVGSATVTVNLTFGSFSTQMTGTTDGTGHASFTWTVPLIQGSGVVTTTATAGGVSGTNQKIMEVTIGPPMPSAQLSLSSTRPVIRPGETSTVTAKVTNSAGVGLAGVTVSIDTTLVLGTVTPSSGTSDANGVVQFTYHAPADASKFPNQHLTDVIKANMSVPNTIAADTQAAEFTMVVQNDAAPNWNITAVQVPLTGGFEVSPASQSQVVQVLVTNFAGVPQSGVLVDANYSVADVWNITVTPTTAGSDTTDGSGIASFTIAETSNAVTDLNNTNVVIRFVPDKNPFATSDTILLLVSDGTSAGYSAHITYPDSPGRMIPYDPVPQSDNISVQVWNELGLADAGVPVILHIDYGPFGPPAQFPFSMVSYGATDIYTGDWIQTPEYSGSANFDASALGGGSIGGSFQNSTGPLGPSGSARQGYAYGLENAIEDYEVIGDGPNLNLGYQMDSCDPTTWPSPTFGGVYIINATSVTTASLTSSSGYYNNSFVIDHEKTDSPIQVQAFIGAAKGATPHLEVLPCTPATFEVGFNWTIDSGVVTERAPIFALAQVQMSKPIVTSQSNSVTIHAQFLGVDGAVPYRPVVFLTQGASSAGRNVKGTFGGALSGSNLADPKLGDGSTNYAGWDNGWFNYTRTVTGLSLSQALTFTFLPADSRYAYSGKEQLYAGDYGDYWISPSFEVLNAKLPFGFTIAYMYLPTSTAFMTVSLGSTLLPAGGNTTATVTVYSSLNAKPIAGASVWSGSTQVVTNATGVATLPVVASTLGATEGLVVATTAYGGTARGWYAYIASNPVLTYSNIAVTPAVTGSPSTITVTATNTLAVAGTTTAWLSIDGNNSVAQVVTMTASGSKTLTFSYVFTTTGAHTVAVGSASTTVTIAAPPPADMTLAYALAGGLLVVGLVVGAVLGLMMSRRGKKPPTSAPEEPETPSGTEKPAEEELGPGEQL